MSWLEFKRVMGKPNDQLAFNYAVDAAEARLTILPCSYNAQIAMNVMTLRGAISVHFFTGSFENSLETISHTTAKRLKSDGIMDTSAIQSPILSGNPWTRIDSYRKAVAASCYFSIGRVAFETLAKRLGAQLNGESGRTVDL